MLPFVLVAVTTSGCRPDTVTLGFQPAPGATYRYRYELELHLERALDGSAAKVTDLDTVITAEVTIVSTTPAGTRARLAIRRDGGTAQRLTVVIDRAGSLRGIEEIAGLPTSELGVGGLGAVLGLAVAPPPTGPVAIGDTWSFGDDGQAGRPITGDARLDRLGVIDGEKVAEVGSALRSPIDEAIDAGPSGTQLSGEIRSDASTTYDLVDGAIRRAHAVAHGDVDVLIHPPAGSQAADAHGTITYDLVVRTTRV